MKIFAALALFSTVTTVFGYTCYMCASMTSTPCTATVNCEKYLTNLTSFLNYTNLNSLNLTQLANIPGFPGNIDLSGFPGNIDLTGLNSRDLSGFSFRCYTAKIGLVVMRGCMIKEGCVSPLRCCKGDLCNSAPHTLSSVLLLGLSAFITLYLNLYAKVT